MADHDRERAVQDLLGHARNFLDSGLWSHTGYFPDDSHGKEAQRYYDWSKKAYRLICKLGKADAR